MMLLTTIMMMTMISAMIIITKYSLPTIDFATRYSDFCSNPTRLCLLMGGIVSLGVSSWGLVNLSNSEVFLLRSVCWWSCSPQAVVLIHLLLKLQSGSWSVHRRPARHSFRGRTLNWWRRESEKVSCLSTVEWAHGDGELLSLPL